MIKEFKLTQKHFDKFVLYCKEWVDIFGLMDWRVTYIFGNEKDYQILENSCACIAMNREGMAATVYLNSDWDTLEPTDFELRRTAFHEVIGELVLQPLVVLATARFNVDEPDIFYEVHRIIRRLENIVIKYIP